jgi:hypothetical protein
MLRVRELAENHLDQALRGHAPSLVQVRQVLVDDRSRLHSPTLG